MLPKPTNDASYARGQAYKVVNRLLDVYRVATKEPHVGHIPASEMNDATICVVDDDWNLLSNASNTIAHLETD